MDLSGYVLQPIREDSEFVLYRARAKTLEPSSILLLSPLSSRPSLETLRKIDHEYSMKGELDSAWAVRPLALSRWDDKKALVLEDLGGEPISRLIRGPMETKPFLWLAIALANAIRQLHMRDVMQRTSTPRTSSFHLKAVEYGLRDLDLLRALGGNGSPRILPSSLREHYPTWHLNRRDE